MARAKGRRATKRMSIMAEQSFFGPDPSTLGAKFDKSRVGIINALNWYARFSEMSEAKAWVAQYVKAAKLSASDRIRFARADDKHLTMTMGAIARLHNAGIVLPDQKKFLDGKIKAMIATVPAFVAERAVSSVPVIVHKHIDLVDNILDQFYDANYSGRKIKIDEQLKAASVRPHHLQPMINHLKKLADEIALIGKDADVTEGYIHLTKRNVSAYKKFVGAFIDQLREYGKVAKVVKVRKPRKKKAKSATQIVKKSKFLAKDLRTGISGATPADVVGASTVYIYHASWNKITKLTAADGKTLTIKGTTIVGFDPKLSTCKRARKAGPLLKKIQAAGKVDLRKALDTIKTKPIAPSGRLNDKTLIVRVVK